MSYDQLIREAELEGITVDGQRMQSTPRAERKALLVQILVDCLVALAPFALYAKVGVFTIPLVGLLCVFFRGFLALSKSFLDPFGNEDSLSENLSVHCLVCEVNAGSVRWASGIEELPRCGYSLAAGRGARR